jgi:hypothetical protein
MLKEYFYKIIDNLISTDSFFVFLGAFAGAFFAFCFFIFNEYRKEKKTKIIKLWNLTEYLENVLLFFKLNISLANDMLGIEYGKIVLDNYSYFRIKNNLFSELGVFKLTEDVSKFNLSLENLNAQFNVFNNYLNRINQTYSKMSDNNRHNYYKNSMEENLKNFKESQEKIIKLLKKENEENERLIKVTGFFVNYFDSNFLVKKYYDYKMKKDKDFIKKWLVKNKKNEKSKN